MISALLESEWLWGKINDTRVPLVKTETGHPDPHASLGKQP